MGMKYVSIKPNNNNGDLILALKEELRLLPIALACVAQRIERWPVNQRVVGSISSQGTCLVCGPCP